MRGSWKPVLRALAFGTTAALSMTLTTTALANETGNELVGGFEIDGNYYEGFDNDSTADDPGDPQGTDWGAPEVEAEYDHVVDRLGGPDETVYDGGSKEDDLESWNDDSSAAPPGDADINNVYVHDLIEPDTGDQYAFVAWDRATDTGTVQWFLELNQQPNTTNDNDTSVPDRTDGDVRISFINHGNGDFTVETVETWDAATEGWESIVTPLLRGATNDSTISVPDGMRTEQLFNEFGFNLTELTGDGDDCAFTGLSAINLRSEVGAGAQSELKDYATGRIDIPSRCGDIRIEKEDSDGNPLGGATFEITPDPTPGSDAPSLVVTDNDSSDADPADGVIVISPAEPGDYTVTETEPPPGYIEDEEPQDVTLDEYGSATVTFANTLGSISWSKTDAENGEQICCATFEVSPNPLIGEPADPPLTVVDNGEYDTDPADGMVTIEDVKTGTYTVTETVPPDGYELPDDSASDPVTVDADNADVTISDEFADPRTLSELTVRKVAEDDDAALAGATFELYLDDGDGVGGGPDAGDDLIDSCTTEDDGTCTIGELGFGDYYWYETEAPSGYEIPSDATSDIITINAGNAGTEMAPTTFADPPEDAPPSPPDDEPTPPDDESPSPQPSPELPDTGSRADIPGVVGLLLVGGGATIWLFARRRA